MKKETSNVAIAFLLGLVSGGVAALLLAPYSGKETREKLKEGFKKATDKALETFEETKEVTKAHKDALKTAFEEGKEAYKRSLEEKK